MMKKMFLGCLAVAGLAATGLADALSLSPAVPTAEWTKKWWLTRFDEKKALAATSRCDVVFIGDSITHFWETKGTNVWAKNFADGDFRALGAGFSGDRTEHVLWRLQHGQLDGLDPKAVVLMIGTNNSGHRTADLESPFDTFCGVVAVVEDLEKRCPHAQVILHPIFPRGATTNDAYRIRNDAVNLMLKGYVAQRTVDWKAIEKDRPGKMPAPRILWCDFSDKMLTADGVLTKDMAPDLLHPGEAGYEIWAKELRPFLSYALGKTAKRPSERRVYGPTAIPQTGPRAAVAAPQRYWLTGLKGKNLRFQKKVNEIADNPSHFYDVVLLGDSITHFWEQNFPEHYARTFAGLKTLNLAWGGHHTESVLWNVTYGGFLARFQTRLFTLLIGTNNRDDSAEDTALGIRRILEALAARQPNAKVILMPVFPRRQDAKGDRPAAYQPGSPERIRNDRVSELVRPLADGRRVFWCDFNDKLVPNGDGIPPPEILKDGVHPSEKGYDIWAAEMMPLVRKLLAD